MFASSDFTKHYKGFILNALAPVGETFQVFVCKEGSKEYLLYSEDHEPNEIAKWLGGPSSYTNREAAFKAGAEFANDFYECFTSA